MGVIVCNWSGQCSAVILLALLWMNCSGHPCIDCSSVAFLGVCYIVNPSEISSWCETKRKKGWGRRQRVRGGGQNNRPNDCAVWELEDLKISNKRKKGGGNLRLRVKWNKANWVVWKYTRDCVDLCVYMWVCWCETETPVSPWGWEN